MKRSESTLDPLEPLEPLEASKALEPQANRKDQRRDSFVETRQWLEARNAKVGSTWVGGDWAERRTRRTLH